MIKSPCIWCLGNADEQHVEHIIPEALGCPPNFVLPGSVVCRKCNNGLAHLDQAVIDDFDIPAFMANVPRKRGRPPAVRSRGNFIATVEATGPTYTFNMEPHPVTAHDGSRVAPYRGSPRDIRATINNQGPLVSINFQSTFGHSRKFIRGVTKIAFSSLAYFKGANVVRRSTFDPIRRFVKHGKGDRHVLLGFDSDTSYANRAWPPYVSQTGDFAIAFRIAFVEFLVDLSSEELHLTSFVSRARQEQNGMQWCVLPIDD